MKATIPAVAYYRMSTDKQEASIPDQRKAVEKFAEQNGYRILREYSDEGISGWKSTERKGFSKLIDDAPNGEFKAVLCWDIDRFSRFDPLEANHYWYLLDRAGVHLATVAQGQLDWHDLGGWLSASVQQHGKSQYVKDLARNSARGTRERRLAGKWCGPPPYGYALESGRLVLGDPEKIANVRRIFSMRGRGASLTEIAETLNSEGIPTPRNTLWRTIHVRTILDRETYLGVSVVGKHSQAAFCKIVEEPVTLPDTHEAIIDRETWDRVQAMPRLVRRNNGRGGGPGGRLSGLVRCGRCGGPMYCNRVTGDNYYYICASYHEGKQRCGKGCGHCAVKRERLEDAVFTVIRDKVLLGSQQRLEAAIAKKLSRRGGENRADRRKSLGRQIATLTQQIDQATERLLLVDPDLLPGAQVKLRELIAKRDSLEDSLRAAERSQERQLEPSKVAAMLWTLPDAMRNGKPEAARTACQLLIDHVEVGFEFDSERSTAKRKRFKITGAHMHMRSSDEATEGVLSCAVWSSQRGPIWLPEELLAA